MAYVKKDWLDQNVQFPKRYTVSRVAGAGSVDDGDAIEMDTNFGIETEAGTDFLATYLNNIEVGVESLYNGDGLYVDTAGSANTYIATFTEPFTALTTGLTLRTTFNIENTGASTFKLDSLTTEDLKKINGTGKVDTEAGDIVVGTYIIVYDGTDWVIVNQFKVKPMTEIFTASGTFNAPFTGNYKVTVCGGGAGGSSTGTASNTRGGGGGTGGTCIEIVTLTKADAVTVTIGSGGAQQTTTDSDGVNGNNGGASSFGAYCTANGGSGGVSGSSFGIGGTGGTGTGGDVNITGAKGNFTFESNGLNCNNNVKQPHILFGESYGYGGGGGTGTGDFGDAGADGIVIVDWMEG